MPAVKANWEARVACTSHDPPPLHRRRGCRVRRDRRCAVEGARHRIASPRRGPAPALHRRARHAGCRALGGADQAGARSSGWPTGPTWWSKAATRSWTRCTRPRPTPRRSGPCTSGSTRASARRSPTSSETTTAGPARAPPAIRSPARPGRCASTGCKSSWYALRLGAWKLIVLDSIELTGGGAYVGRLGDEQTAWLRRELAATPRYTHVVLVSHIPIQTALPFTDAGLREADGSFRVPGGWGVHSDLPEINEILLDHPNVRLALSGHNHVRDDITYNTVRFACGGAVSGNWWDEADPGYRDTPPGIAIVDLPARRLGRDQLLQLPRGRRARGIRRRAGAAVAPLLAALGRFPLGCAPAFCRRGGCRGERRRLRRHRRRSAWCGS